MNRNVLLFETFREFCNRADEILDEFSKAMNDPNFNYLDYQSYIEGHKFCKGEYRDLLVKDTIWEWLMSYKYEKKSKDDLFKLLSWVGKDS
ncbi:MAG: hypothetical protein IKO78_02515 [Bacilli bacterium]|nr:hypothetical protein [Bacilli bacterium]